MRAAAKPPKIANFNKQHYQKGLSPSRFDIFKHLVLSRVFDLTNKEKNSSWTYIDFNAGPGRVPIGAKSEALQRVYKHGTLSCSTAQLLLFVFVVVVLLLLFWLLFVVA